MVDNADSDTRRALQCPEITEQRSHLPRHILICRVKSHQRIKNQKGRAMECDRCGQPVLINGTIQVQRIGSDDIYLECIQVELMVSGKRLQPEPDG
jgi:hypothetical protein